MKKFLIGIALGIFLHGGLCSAVATAVPEELRFDEKALYHYAETHGYGYKTGNLYELQKLVKQFNQSTPPLKVEVPDFMGIASDNVVKALADVGFEIAEEWAIVLNAISAKEKATALSSKQIPEKFWTAQKGFVEKLREAFKKLPKDNPFGLDEANKKALTNLFAQAKNDRLMVRSTGKEDTRKIANAGGNESIANVAPTMAAVLAAAEEVVVSYFGEKSLNQRLGLGDETLFAEKVFCPILVQRMIGENKEGVIPSCGVMFTEEAEGGIGYNEEKGSDGRIKTTGITMIQAAYGHNEGVVNSKVVVDTFVSQMIDSKPVFYPVIQAKRKRLVPADNGLVMTKNPSKAVIMPALSKQALVTLKLFADNLENYYGYPMDVEFVVRDATVWIVQARPITHSAARKSVKPRYFANLEAFKMGSMFKGRTIGAFGGAIVEVPEPSQCIISERIGTALDGYPKSGRDRIKCVFSGTDAPATSHEATTFRGEGKPVLYVPEVEKLRVALAANAKLIFSPQQHCVAAVDKGFHPEIKEGWCAYPLPRELSVVPILFFGVDEKTFGRPKPFGDKADIKTLLAEMAEEHNENALKAAQIFPSVLLQRIEMEINKFAIDADLKKQIGGIVLAAQVLCAHIAWLIENNASLANLLLPINYLEALMYQNSSKEMELGYLSLDRLKEVVSQERVVTKKEGFIDFAFKTSEERVLYTQLLRARISCFNEDARQAWGSFIKKLLDKRTIKENVEFVNIFTHYARSGILPMWLNMTFTKETKDMEVALLLNKITKEYSQDKNALSGLAETKKEIESLNVVNFGNPKYLDKEFDGFVKKYIKDGANEDKAVFGEAFITNFASQSATIKMYALDVMGMFVNNGFDLLIKEVRASRQFDTVKLHVTAFKKVVSEYVKMLTVWSGLFATNDKEYKDKAAAIIMQVNKILNQAVNDEKMLDASKGFAVNAHLFSNSEVGEYKTVSDVFTTMHQNLLMLISWTMTKFFTIAMLPEELQGIHNKISSVDMSKEETYGKKIELLSVNFEKELITLRYNIPMRLHSMGMAFTYNRTNKEVVVEFRNVFMNASMPALHVFLKVVAHALRWTKIRREQLGSSVVTFTFALSKDQLKEALDVITDKCFLNVVFLIADNMNLEKIEIDSKSTWLSLVKEFKEAIATVQEAVKIHDNSEVRKIGLNLYKALVKKGYGFDEAIAAAAEAVKSTNYKIRSLGLELFKALFEKGQGFNEAMVAAAEAVQNANDYIRSLGLELFEALLEKGQGFNEAIAAAAKAVKSTNDTIQSSGLELFKALLEKGQGFNEAMVAAAEAVQNANDYIRSLGLELFEALLEKGQGFNKAIAAAAEAVKSTNDNIQDSGLRLFKALVEKDKEFIAAIAAAAEAMKSTYYDVQEAGLRLFKALFEKGQGFNEAIAAAAEAVKNNNYTIQSSGLRLFKALVEKGEEFAEAMVAAAKAVKSTNYKIRSLGLRLFKALVEKDKEFIAAIAAAAEAVKSTNYDVQEAGLKLFKALVEKGQEFKVYQALKSMTEKERSKRKDLQELFESLEEN